MSSLRSAVSGEMSSESVTRRDSGHSYLEILKSTTVIGGSQAITILLGIIRTKVTAVLLGPGGVGLMGIYSSITSTTSALVDMGISGSGVRQIAEAVGTGDGLRISRTILALRRIVFCLGLLGAGLLVLFSEPVCNLSFGDSSHANAVALLAVTVLLTSVSGGQMALLQGIRRIADLAGVRVMGAVLGTVAGLPLLWWWRENGIVPSLVAVAAASLVASWWFARRVRADPVRLTIQETCREARALLGLGAAFMASSIMAALVTYGIRALLVRNLGLDAAGHYQAAWALSAMYVGIILQSMGTDFYPRLTAAASDNVTCNRMVNEQAQVSLLLAVPGILATLVLAPAVIYVFYSSAFGAAVEILRWLLLGLMLRVVAWPVGFILLAKGNARWFFWTELAANLVHIAGVWFFLQLWGLPGVGVAFVTQYAFHWIQMAWVTRHVSGFRYSPANRRLLLLGLPVVGGVFLIQCLLSPAVAMAVGGAVTLVVVIYAVKSLTALPGSPVSVLLTRLANRLRRRR